MTDIELRSLATEYNKEHHQTYVSRLNAAVCDPRNKNIALTGRYGADLSYEEWNARTRSTGERTTITLRRRVATMSAVDDGIISGEPALVCNEIGDTGCA